MRRAYKLNFKTCYPTSIEGQSVPLTLNIFHPTTIATLRSSRADYTSTADFLDIIRRCWNNVSNTNAFHGIQNEEDSQLLSLQHFQNWLLKWKECDPLDGCLSKDTFKAIFQLTTVLTDICIYLFQQYTFSYLLLSKF